VTTRDQVTLVAHAAGISAAQARLALYAVAGVIKAGLLEDERVALTGVGTFSVQYRSPRRVRNPSTGVMMDLPASRAIKFKPTPELRSSVEERG
jgi:DNA-binding protein HU-beta